MPLLLLQVATMDKTLFKFVEKGLFTHRVSPKNLQKLSVYDKYLHREISWKSLCFTRWSLFYGTVVLKSFINVTKIPRDEVLSLKNFRLKSYRFIIKCLCGRLFPLNFYFFFFSVQLWVKDVTINSA